MKQLLHLPQDRSAPETAPNVMRKRERHGAKNGTKRVLGGCDGGDKLRVKDSPVGEKEKKKLLKAELAFLSITALAHALSKALI